MRAGDYPEAVTTTSPREWWTAAQRRDPAFDGAFVFGVVSTGIYCRPSCPARRPLAKNVRLFSTGDAAARDGFRPCKRCRPDDAARPTLAVRASDWLRRRAAGRVTLSAMARSLDVSPYHLQRTFKNVLGVTPAAYVRVLRFERFRREGKKGVAPALYGAGFGSPSRLYERARARLGMTPATALNGGARMTIAYDIVDCPLGRALLAATPRGICAVEFGDSDRTLAAGLSARYPRASIRRDPGLLRRAGAHLRRIFGGKPADPSIPLDVRATAFQARVWEELRAIPAGATRSYSEIARRIGRPGAARAVARACASNSIALLIPCHRAVGADGALSGYRWGVARKQELLTRERRRPK